MQKFFAVFALVAVLVGLAGCGGGGSSSPVDPSPRRDTLRLEPDWNANIGWRAPRDGQQVLGQFIATAPDSEGASLWWLDLLVSDEFQFDYLDLQVGGERVYASFALIQANVEGAHLLEVRFDSKVPLVIPAGKQAIITLLVNGLQLLHEDPIFVNDAVTCTGAAIGVDSGTSYEMNVSGFDGFIGPEDAVDRDELRGDHLGFYMLSFLLNMNQNGGVIVGGDPLPTVPTMMGSSGYDIIKLVGVVGSWPRPIDPSAGYYNGAGDYNTGYTIVYDPVTNQITLTAPHAEGEVLQVSGPKG